MIVENMKQKGTWREVADAARTTVHMEPGTNEPSYSWKKRMLLTEHSPIRKLVFNWKWKDLKYWVSVHLVRHKIGIEHFVRTQRSDRTGVNRDELPQGASVEHECEANAQAILFISRRRLCNQASLETRLAWKAVIEEIMKVDPVLAECCVPECIYRGVCPEIRTCGFSRTEEFKNRLQEYRET
ncbi:MAG: thymidylate synthase ThyX [Paludibacteraceae bacterium]|nr:thymidylate synthase ThyX [Paludibacteraceae bacterium]